MKALVYTATRKLEVQQLPQPAYGDHDVLVQVHAVGVCGSDLDGFLGKSKKRVPPLVLGHEFSGEVAACGSAVHDLPVGTKVAVYPLIGCRHCRYCTSGREHLCAQRKVYGLDFHGGLAEFTVAPRDCVFSLPQGMTLIEGALVEPLANALHVLEQFPPLQGKAGLVYGAGPIGLMVFWAAKHLGAGPVAVVDLNPRRLELMRLLGAEPALLASADPVEAILRWSGGEGVEFAVDAVGVPIARRNTLACTARGATAIWIGLAGEVAEIDARDLVTREITLRGSYAYRKPNFARAIEILALKTFPVERVVSEFAFEQGQDAFEALASGESPVMKAVFVI